MAGLVHSHFTRLYSHYLNFFRLLYHGKMDTRSILPMVIYEQFYVMLRTMRLESGNMPVSYSENTIFKRKVILIRITLFVRAIIQIQCFALFKTISLEFHVHPVTPK